MSTLATIHTVSFDAFGTLVRFERPRRPFVHLIAALNDMGLVLPGDVRDRVMSEPWDLPGCARALGASPAQLATLPLDRWNEDLVEEARSVVAFEESLSVLEQLRARGYRLAIVSNLALPYVAMVRHALPGVRFDVERWSCWSGMVKPDPRMMSGLGRAGDTTAQTLHVGDTWSDDVVGAQRAGATPAFLQRSGRGTSNERIEGVLCVPNLQAMLDLLPVNVSYGSET